MKRSQKVTRIQLSVNEQDKPLIAGIVTPDPDYKISLKLNRKLNISLKKTESLELIHKTGDISLFTRFSDFSAAPDLIIQLISNRSDKNFLLKKLINIDYLLLIYDNAGNFSTEQLITQIRIIDSVTGAFSIDLKTLKDKNLKYLI